MVYAVSMYSTKRLNIALKDVVFFRELPVILGISEDYAKRLARPTKGVKHAYLRSFGFPRPIMVSQGGIRVWKYAEIEAWALSMRMKGRFGIKMEVPILDDPDSASRALGRPYARGS